MANSHPSYSPSFITHQRRPALIPANVILTPEDEQAVRMRTGYVNPLSRGQVFFQGGAISQGHDWSSEKDNGQHAIVEQNGDSSGEKKRKREVVEEAQT